MVGRPLLPGVIAGAAIVVLCLAGPPAIGRAGSASTGNDGKAARTELVIATATAKYRFQIEVARTAEQRRTGLMFRRHLAADAGMLFTFDPPQLVSMWMKNTVLPLDMLFIDTQGRIVNIARDTTPFSLDRINSDGPVAAVLEVAGGTAERLGIKAGDRVEHELFSPCHSNRSGPDRP